MQCALNSAAGIWTTGVEIPHRATWLAGTRPGIPQSVPAKQPSAL